MFFIKFYFALPVNYFIERGLQKKNAEKNSSEYKYYGVNI